MSESGNEDADIGPVEREPMNWSRFVGGGWVFILLIVLIVIFSLLRPTQFFSPFNLSNIAVNAAILLVLSVGQTFVMIAGGVDLSIGAVLVFSSVVAAQVMLHLSDTQGGSFGTTDASLTVVMIGGAAAVLSGTLWGMLNGFLIAVARIPPLIVTLGTLSMALGSAQILSGGVDIRAIPERLVIGLGGVGPIGLPNLVLIAVVVAAIGAVLLHQTRFGLHVYAIGSNIEAARRSGIKVKHRVIVIYGICGGLAGVAAIMSLARFGTTTIAGHSMDNLATITAVLLGGASLFGGAGSVVGTTVGVFIPIILLNGFIIMGIPPFWQTVAMGAVLITTVFIDQLKRRARERGQ